jgi:hypothetical protein
MTAASALRWLTGGFLALESLLRGAFVADLVRRDLIDADVIGSAMLAGIANDLLALLVVALPLMLAAALLPRRSAVSRRLFAALLALGVGVTLLVALGDALFWFEFGSRADGPVCCNTGWPDALRSVFVAPRSRLVAAFGLVALLWLLFRRLVEVAGALIRAPRAGYVAGVGLSLVIHGLGMGPGPELLVVRPGVSAPVNVAANNGLLAIAHAATVQAQRWDGVFPRPDARAMPILLGAAFGRAPTDFDAAPRHLILVAIDSAAPFPDALRQRGVYFDRVYATGAGLSRMFEAVLHGMPPLPGPPRNSRSGPERLPSLPRALATAGFQTIFVAATNPDAGAPAAYWRDIGFALTAAGADETVFDTLLQELDQRARGSTRVFAATLATGSALTAFVSAAAQRPWFDDTLIAIVATPRPQLRGTALIPVDGYRVPALLIWPEGLTPRVVHRVGSTLDVPRTVLALLDVDTDEELFGRDLFGMAGPGAINVAPVEYDYRPGIVTDTGLTVLMRGAAPLSWTFERSELIPVARRDAQVRLAAAVFVVATQVAAAQSKAGD